MTQNFTIKISKNNQLYLRKLDSFLKFSKLE